MDIEPILHTHVIGFPYYASSKSSNNDDKNHNMEHELDSSSIYRPLYEISNAYLKNGYNILYAAESLPDEQDKAKVVENIRNATDNNNKDIQNNISTGLLNVINSDTTYKDNSSGTDIVDFLLSNVSEMQRKSSQQQQQQKTKGTMIFNTPDPFFNHKEYDVFIEFEKEVGKRLSQYVGLLCWYKTEWLNKLSLSHAISVLAHHKYTVHSDWEHKQWNPDKIIDVISKGIDNNLGEGSSILLFQTLKSVHKLKQDSIVDRSDVFEERLKRVLGKDDANSVLNSIFEEIIKAVEFGLTDNNNGPKSKKR